MFDILLANKMFLISHQSRFNEIREDLALRLLPNMNKRMGMMSNGIHLFPSEKAMEIGIP